METNPLLARRVIPRRERLQKALVALLLTILTVAGIWVFTGASVKTDVRNLVILGTIALLGASSSAYFWFKRYEAATTKESSRAVRHRIDDERQGHGWLSRLGHNVKRFLAGIVVFVGLLIALAGLGVLASQLFGYLKTGVWESISAFGVAAPYFPWLYHPQSWFGLHAVVRDMLEILPLSLALIICGWVIAGIGSAMRQRISR